MLELARSKEGNGNRVPQFDLIFIGHPDPTDPGWPGLPFQRTGHEFVTSVPLEVVVAFNIRDQFYGGTYIRDLDHWDVNGPDTVISTTISGESVVTTWTFPKRIELIDLQCDETIRPPDPEITIIEPAPAATRVLRPLFCTRNAFISCLTRNSELTPPVSIMKLTATGDPRYFLTVPKQLPIDKPPALILTMANNKNAYLYRCRVSGVDRHGLYNYVKKANRTVNGWLTNPDDNDWHLLDIKISKYIREQLMSQILHPPVETDPVE